MYGKFGIEYLPDTCIRKTKFIRNTIFINITSLVYVPLAHY